jgi:hypothetical protein
MKAQISNHPEALSMGGIALLLVERYKSQDRALESDGDRDQRVFPHGTDK